MAQAELTAAQKVFYSVSLFLEAFKNLGVDGKRAFETQIRTQMETQDARTRQLYQVLLDGVSAGLSSSAIISKMESADAQFNKKGS